MIALDESDGRSQTPFSRYAGGDSVNTTMREEKRKRLERKGWRIGTAQELLGLSSEETTYIELKLRLAEGLRKRRARKKVSQVELARLVKSSQSRVAKMEAGDPSVSIDLLVKTLLALGVTRQELAEVIRSRDPLPT
jgi:ribosome-binding protein aMBF1 (putative translation factor)